MIVVLYHRLMMLDGRDGIPWKNAVFLAVCCSFIGLKVVLEIGEEVY